MHLECSYVLQIKRVRRAAKEAAELGDCMHIRSLSRRRKIADRHVLDHAASQRAHLGHRGLPFQGWGESTQTLADRTPPDSPLPYNTPARVSGLVQSAI